MAEGWERKGIKAEMSKVGFDKNGDLTITFTVPDKKSKYDVLPITDIKGRMFELDIRCLSTRVFAGEEGLAEIKERNQQRKLARKLEDDNGEL